MIIETAKCFVETTLNKRLRYNAAITRKRDNKQITLDGDFDNEEAAMRNAIYWATI